MYTTEGIILERTDAGEADTLFTIYTKDFGKIRALARGIKKEGAKLKGHLEPVSLSSISFVLGRNGERLTRAALLNFWPAIRVSCEKLRLARAMVDLVDKECFPGQKDEKLWGLFLESLYALEGAEFKNGDGENFLQSFQDKLSSALGYAGISEPAFSGYTGHNGQT